MLTVYCDEQRVAGGDKVENPLLFDAAESRALQRACGKHHNQHTPLWLIAQRAQPYPHALNPQTHTL
jgi:hypothetical protein